ncbi:MAG TPA: adenylate kinase [Verrucomicrobiales bacterium]|nr:adenylate kinase [Verrucomicrobiales bacterium]
MYRTFLLFGAPGAGKGTQGKILGTIPNFFHFACGDAFRNLKIESNLGRTFLHYSSQGKLVPDEPTIELWRREIDASVATGRFSPESDTLVLDGLPRNTTQADMLKPLLDVRAVFCLKCSDMEQMVKRLQHRAIRENRLDDANLAIIRARLETYERETKPVLDYYGPSLVHQIDSAQQPTGVLIDILNVVRHLPD